MSSPSPDQRQATREVPPKVCVLFATYNGAQWIEKQLQTIFAQKGVEVRVIASDDASTDATPALLQQFAQATALTILPAAPQKFGNANRNFMRLVFDAPLGDADYIAFSDQDDVWERDKLAVSVDTLKQTNSEGYSSDVVAFWPDGREKLLRKAGMQRRLDYLFESAGPGCTFVLTRPSFDAFKIWAGSRRQRLLEVKVHDWLIYAYYRTQGLRWYIDPRPTLRYRQHQSNEAGANVGLAAAQSRLKLALSGRYRLDILRIADAIDCNVEEVIRLKRFSTTDRIVLMLKSRGFRRRAAEACLLVVMWAAMRRIDYLKV